MSAGWILVTDRLPSMDEFGPYPLVEVVVQCDVDVGHTPIQSQQFAELRFLGGNPARPIWVNPAKPHEPIENSAWFVTHWRPRQPLPAPVVAS